MAIVIQENKQGFSNVLYIGVWALLILGVMIGIYYVFFKKPEIYESALNSANLNNNQNINNILKAKSSIDINNIIQRTQSLKSYINIQTNFKTGKENPFF